MRIYSLFAVSAAAIVAITPVLAQSTGAMSGRQSDSTSPNGAMSGNGADNGMMSDTMASPSSKGMAGTKPMAKKSMHHKRMPVKKPPSSGMTPNDR